MTRRWLLTSGGCCAAALVLAVTLAPPVQLILVADDGLMYAGETRLVSGRNDPSPYDPPVEAPAVSDGGRFIAYQRGPTDYYSDTESQEPTYEIRVRDQSTGDEELISPAEGANTAPSISGDGSLVAYTTPTGVYVVDRTDPDNRIRHRVTGGRGDLPYQRTLECTPRLDFDDVTEGGCGPVLSGDGTSIAVPSRLSVVSPSLEPIVTGEDDLTYLDYQQHGLAMLDFRERQSEAAQLTLQRTVTLRVTTGSEPVSFGEPTVSSDGSFDLFGTNNPCSGQTVDPGEECAIGVEFTRTVDCTSTATSYGLLQVNSPTPSGQTAIALVGDHQSSCGSGSARTLAADCPDSGDLPSEQLGTADPQLTRSVVNMREVDVGQTYVATQEVVNNDPYSDQTVSFTSADCSVQLVEPEPSGSDLPPPCTDGLTLGPEDNCTAYVRYQPESVGPAAATLTVSYDSYAVRRFRFVGSGGHVVVAMRRDLTGTGNFAGPGRPAIRVVSADADGVPMRGAAPSLSSDGRYVAFVSGFSWSLEDPFADDYQVYVHDTDRKGDRTYQPGDTTNVSRVEGGEGEQQAHYVVQPSLSGDASRIAFVDIDVVSGGGHFSPTEAQVHVRDLAAGVSHLVSQTTPADGNDGEPAHGFSYRPSLSRDGSTVAFTSGAEDLLPPGAGADGYAPQVYVRDLAPDFDGAGAPRTDIVSLRPSDYYAEGQAGLPAVDADGGVITFATGEALTDVIHYSTQVYERIRYGGPKVAPVSLEFPPQEIGTRGPAKAVTVTNIGPGPVHVTAETDAPFEITNECEGIAVHRQETCTVLIAFAPLTPGQVDGVVTIRMTAFGWDGEDQLVTVSGLAVPQQYRLSPRTIAFPDQGIGTTGAPVVVRAVNTSSHDFDFEATIGSEAPARAASSDEDFVVTGPGGGDATCKAVEPGAACQFLVSFSPSSLDPSAGQLAVVATSSSVASDAFVESDLEFAQLVGLTGETAEPVVEVSPTVAREGRVVFVSGSNFLPGQPLLLLWSGGGAVFPVVVPDADGLFTAPVVILRDRDVGTHLLTVTMPGIGTFDAPPVIVVPGSLQPPDFASRN